MKTILICVGSLVIGTVIGYSVAAYAYLQVHDQRMNMELASMLGTMAMDAEFLKSGNVDYVIEIKERGIPDIVKIIAEVQRKRESSLGYTSLRAAKRFYICTNTEIPDEIAHFLEDIPMFENGCGGPAGNLGNDKP